MAGRPRRFAHTTAGAGVIRCRNRGSGASPASAGCPASRFLRDSEVEVRATNDRALHVCTGDNRANRQSLAATDATPSHRPSMKAPLPGVFGQLAMSGKCGRLGARLDIFIERLDYPTLPLRLVADRS